MLNEKLGNGRRGAWVALLGLTLIIAGWAQGTLACDLDGGGVAEAPWLVTSAADLDKVGEGDCLLSGHYYQTTDIDLGAFSEGEGWNPIGSYLERFSGTYDGGGHAITGLVINRSGQSDVGLFGFNTGTLKNLHVSGDVTGSGNVGGLAGRNIQGLITQASASGNVSGTIAVGGLVGTNANTLGTLTQVSASGNVTGQSIIGGLVGYNVQGLITQASASGNVSGSNNVYGYNSDVGGLVGRNIQGLITQASASGNVSTASDISFSEGVGGLVGSTWEGTLTQVSASGSVYAPDTVGGLVGISNDSTITQAIASGNVSAGSEFASEVGGLVGMDYGYLTITASFWDIDTTGQSRGIRGAPDPGLLGKTTTELQTLATFTDVGWPIMEGWLPPDSVDGKVWGLCPEANAGYPFLLWAYTANPCAPDLIVYRSYDFGSVLYQTTSTVAITLKNQGVKTLTINGLMLNPGGQGFVLGTTAFPLAILPGDSDMVMVTFTPSGLQSYTDNLIIFSNDPVDPDTTVLLQGLGVLANSPSEQITMVTTYIEEALRDGSLIGVGTNPSANNKINALVNMIESAGDLLEGDETIQGCQQLADIALKVDGAPKPPDFIQGTGLADLAELIQGMRDYYSCE